MSRVGGDWQFLCGHPEDEDPDACRVVGIRHLIDSDSSMIEVLDLEPEEEAERSVTGAAWIRTKATDERLIAPDAE